MQSTYIGRTHFGEESEAKTTANGGHDILATVFEQDEYQSSLKQS